MLTVAAPIAVGLFALRRPPFERFGAQLLVAGVVWWLTTLANADDETLYSIGRIAQWVFEPVLLYLLLSFPTGRLTSRLDRALVRVAVLVVAILYLPTALLVEGYPVPTPVSSCTAGCPPNAFDVSGSEPAFIEAIVRPLREIITISLFAVVAVRIAQRLHGASRIARRALAPVLAVACFRGAAFSGVLIGRRIAPGAEIVAASVWLLTLAVPLTAVAFLAGLARWWVFIARSTRRLAARVHPHSSPEDPAGRPRRGVRRPVAGDRVLAGRRRGTLGRRGRAPGRCAVGGRRPRGDEGQRRGAGAGGNRARRRARARPGIHRHRDHLRRDDDREPSPVGADLVAARRGARIARAHPGGSGRRAPADRARPA